MIKKIKVIHEGQEKEFDIIFSFSTKNDEKKYIVYTDYEEENHFIKCYSALCKDNKIFPVDDVEEVKNIEMILKTLNGKYSIVESN